MLNPSKGNMFEFVTHTWNTVKGACAHDCSYCYMKRWGDLRPTRFDEKELRTDLGTGNTIFVGSSNDLFCKSYPDEWVEKTLEHCRKYPGNTYLFQTKDSLRYWDFMGQYPEKTIFGVTIESNRDFAGMSNAPSMFIRYGGIKGMSHARKIVTIEPVMTFDIGIFLNAIRDINPEWVTIGADTGHNSLPEPTGEEVRKLIEELTAGGLKVVQKKNLDRILRRNDELA